MAGARLVGSTRLPDGTRVRGRGLGRSSPRDIPDFGLYLGAALLRRRHDADLTWPHEWVPWPDGLLPLHWHAAAESIVALHERARAGEQVEVACHGGLGRAGTAMACLAVLSGLTPGQALRWTRAHYHRRAATVPWQRAWVVWFAHSTRRRRGRCRGR
ncbi:protein-tyrosine phosphatase family protein [Saccharomonospora saliphila]|uniref:protein-tyrosine phosphatase family protein n=1 Tax=Saccharomonospora saliphila TaxID=369829 RepID=UPI0009FDF351|nr:protein-tyrosine phosphatase family protein [Saccharomonospora saliphila]